MGDLYLFSFCLPMFSKYSAIDVVFFYMRKRLCGLFLFTLLAKHLCSVSTCPAGSMGRLTWQRAAEDLHPQADAPIIEPGLWVYADVARHHGDGQLVEDRNLLFTVSFKYLLMHKGEKRESFRA